MPFQSPSRTVLIACPSRDRDLGAEEILSESGQGGYRRAKAGVGESSGLRPCSTGSPLLGWQICPTAVLKLHKKLNSGVCGTGRMVSSVQ